MGGCGCGCGWVGCGCVFAPCSSATFCAVQGLHMGVSLEFIIESDYPAPSQEKVER